MELLKNWEELTNKERAKEENESFWKGYLLKESSAYEVILNEKRNYIKGKVSDIAKEVGLDTTFFIGFLDGINTSLNKSIDLETLTEDSEIEIDIDFEILYLNMLKAKADWLYSMEAWNDILTDEKKNEIKKEFSKSQMAKSMKVGRNDACPCGSGKKYKKCCINK
jgi:hypothetical protein